MSAILAAQFTNADLAMVLTILVLLVVLVFLALAEMGLSRMTKPRAASLADQGTKSGRALKRLVDEPERWVNSVLLSVNICQTVQTALTAVVAGRLFGGWGVVVGIVLVSAVAVDATLRSGRRRAAVAALVAGLVAAAIVIQTGEP